MSKSELWSCSHEVFLKYLHLSVRSAFQRKKELGERETIEMPNSVISLPYPSPQIHKDSLKSLILQKVGLCVLTLPVLFLLWEWSLCGSDVWVSSLNTVCFGMQQASLSSHAIWYVLGVALRVDQHIHWQIRSCRVNGSNSSLPCSTEGHTDRW